jgi:hypothetical protein
MADIPFSIQILLAFMDVDERQYYESPDRTEQERKRIYTEFETLWNSIPGCTDAELRMFMRERDWQETEHNPGARNLKRVEWKKHRKADARAEMERHRGRQLPEDQWREDANQINKSQAASPEMSDDLREMLGIPRTRKEIRDAELLQFMPPQLRAAYDKADVKRKAALWEANERNFEAAKEREDRRLSKYMKKSEKAMDLFHRIKEDPTKAHLLPPDDASMDDLHQWHDEMSKPVHIVPFPDAGGYPQAENQNDDNTSRDIRERTTPTAIVTGNCTHYDVCLSFAGEDRAYVERVAATLRDGGVKPFYDKYEQVSLWGKNLYQHLDEVYRQRAQYCVIFISKSYSEKLWTQHELRSAQARAFEENREYILPVRLDDTKLPGLLPTTGYVKDISPEDLAELIIKKLQESERISSAPSSLLEIKGSGEPLTLRDGTPATSDQRTAFFQVWTSLIALERAGQALWDRVTGESLAVFADRQRNAQQSIAGQALFFSQTDYDALQNIMKAADFYLNGKTKLSDICDGQVETQGLNLGVPDERDSFMDPEVRAQIQQNKRWLTRYRNLLADIRVRLHARIK